MMFKPIKLNKDSYQDITLFEKKLHNIINNKISLHEYFITTKDRDVLHCIFMKNPMKKGLFLYAHGNSGHLYHRLDTLKFLGNIGSVILFDYRGYGKSSGTPTPNGFYNDIRAIWDFSTNQLKYKPYHITLYGTSIGCAPVTYLGAKLSDKAENRPYSIIIQSGFSSIKNMSIEIVPEIISDLIVDDIFNNEAHLNKINGKIPILLSHSNTDRVINISHAKKLLKCLKNYPKYNFHKLEGTHGSPLLDNKYLKSIKQYTFT